jgi:hypothetical protein
MLKLELHPSIYEFLLYIDNLNLNLNIIIYNYLVYN